MADTTTRGTHNTHNTQKRKQGKVATLGLGRGGEEAEDLSTADLKFVLVDYYLGRLQQQQGALDWDGDDGG